MRVLCFGTCCFTKERRKLRNGEMNDEESVQMEKWIVWKSCQMQLRERMDITNFIQDSMDFQVVKQMLMASRHKL